MHGVLRTYIVYLVPMIAAPLTVRLFINAIEFPDLVLIGVLIPFYALAARGLSAHFPPENLVHRSTGTMIEYALLQALLFSAFMLFFFRFAGISVAADPLGVAKFLATMTLPYAAISLWSARLAQQKMRDEKA